jgi:hypothetical protein
MNNTDSLVKFEKQISLKHFERLTSVSESDSESECRETGVVKSCVSNLNKHLLGLEDDFLYHISLGKNTNDLKKMFGDVKVTNKIDFFLGNRN